MNPTTNTRAALRYYRRHSTLFLAQGLTSRGQSRRRRILTPSERKFANLEKYRRRAEARAKLGLTTRGTAPKRRGLKPMEGQWRVFKAQMQPIAEPVKQRIW